MIYKEWLHTILCLMIPKNNKKQISMLPNEIIFIIIKLNWNLHVCDKYLKDGNEIMTYKCEEKECNLCKI